MFPAICQTPWGASWPVRRGDDRYLRQDKIPEVQVRARKMYGEGGRHKWPEDVDYHRNIGGALEAYQEKPQGADSASATLSGGMDLESGK